ncbi:unnamed protein product [Medioppia subpectinata]|uniref:Mitochondrial mRNA-processing protein COX24 C-terminal domain-containing protein n=1 Tax=Medioppia subpectinata TaxID=1979941 RepID=A0A7R9PVF7_9ACAR|nr:unnamed protein product [Medioppia subpectinata]CAG2101771.1 unnamed protein product [Medioppia subpectinata]
MKDTEWEKHPLLYVVASTFVISPERNELDQLDHDGPYVYRGKQCLQISLQMTTKFLRRMICSDLQSFNTKSNDKIHECLHYYPIISNTYNIINEIDLKRESILDQLVANKTYIMMNTCHPCTRPVNPILVPNLRQFEITNKETIDWETDGREVVSESPTAMRLDFKRNRNPRAYTHLTVIRRHKMAKHKRRKWRKKMLAFIKKKYLRRNIKKEKVFRAELLAHIKEAEDFDAEKYVHNILHTIDNMPKEDTREAKLERIQDLIRKNRRETNLIKPKFQD